MKKLALPLLLSSAILVGSAGLLVAAREIPSNKQTETVGWKIARQAAGYLGTRYKFGGRGEQGLDCSGLVARIWEDLHLGKLPPNASALFKLGTPVEPQDVQAGDLVFFENTYRRGISHVGIYVDDREFIHASGRRRGVAVSNITQPYYLNRIVGARRLYEE